MSDTYDVLDGLTRHVIVHTHGFVELLDVMPRLCSHGHTVDRAVVEAARVSYQGKQPTSDDRTLLRYLMRHRHTTPFEMVEFKFHVRAPIFVARQWMRHRAASINEVSARYTEVKDDYYIPEVVRVQSKDNRQGGEEAADQWLTPAFFATCVQSNQTFDAYARMLDLGVSRELARINLPQSTYTEWYWKIDLHNLLRFISLRMDSHAQKEIRDYAEVIWGMVKRLAPDTAQAFIDYELQAVRLTRLEVEAMRDGAAIDSTNKREIAEWAAKQRQLGLSRQPAGAAGAD